MHSTHLLCQRRITATYGKNGKAVKIHLGSLVLHRLFQKLTQITNVGNVRPSTRKTCIWVYREALVTATREQRPRTRAHSKNMNLPSTTYVLKRPTGPATMRFDSQKTQTRAACQKQYAPFIDVSDYERQLNRVCYKANRLFFSKAISPAHRGQKRPQPCLLNAVPLA